MCVCVCVCVCVQEVCVQYWPEEKTKHCYGKLTVRNKEEQVINDSLCTRMFEVYRSGSAVAVSKLISMLTSNNIEMVIN